MYKVAKKRFWGSPIHRTPMPPKFKATLKYRGGGLTLNPGVAGAVDEYIFSCNGLFDPDHSGVGHQPTGFDQIMAFYNHYTVIASKIRIEFINTDATNGATVGVWVSANVTEIIDLRRIIEQGSKYKQLTRVGGSRDTGMMTCSVNPNKWLSIVNPMSNPQVRGTIGANPAEQCYFHVFASPFDQSTDSGAVQFAVTIEYTAIFSEPVELNIS